MNYNVTVVYVGGEYMRRLVGLFIIVFMLGSLGTPSVNAYDQSLWAKTYGGKGLEIATSILVAPNGDIIVVGFAKGLWSDYDDSKNIWVLRLDADGNVKWQKVYGGEFDDYTAIRAAITQSGDIVITGSLDTDFDEDILVLCLDSSGNIKWGKTYGSALSDETSDALGVSYDGDIIIGATSGTFLSSAWIIRLDSEGNIKWQKLYSHKIVSMLVVNSIDISSEGDIIVAGNEGLDIWVLKLDANGNIRWQKTYGGSEKDVAYAVAVADNGDIIVAGYTESFGSGNMDAWVLRLDPYGNVKWQKAYGGSNNETAFALSITDNGDILVAGYTESFGEGHNDIWVLRLDSNGNIKWQKTYGGYFDDAAFGLATSYEAIYVVGGTGSYGRGNGDFWVLKLPFDGEPTYCTFCRDSHASVVSTTAEVGVPEITLHSQEFSVRNLGIKSLVTNAAVETQYTNMRLVTISSNPPSARVYLDGKYLGITPLTSNLPPGNYTLKLIKEEYFEYADQVSIKPGGTPLTLSVDLIPTFGYVTVVSYPSGAEVHLDGKYIGDTPVKDYKLSVGNHTILIKKEGYYEYNETMNITPGRTALIEAFLSPYPAVLKITSDPSGAKVYIDGQYKGETPLTLELAPESWIIQIEKEGYVSHTETISLSPRENTTFHATLTPAIGYITVLSEPVGAEIYLDGTYIGKTPLTDYQVSADVHTIVLKKDDYKNYTTKIAVMPLETKQINVSLERIPGHTSISQTSSTPQTTPDTNEGTCGTGLILVLTLLSVLMIKPFRKY